MVISGTDDPVLAPLDGSELIAGIRPETLALARPGTFDPVLMLVVEHSEYLGADTVLTGCVVRTAHRLQARLAGRHDCAAGDLIRLAFPAASVHLFDATTGLRLAREPAFV